MELLVTGSGDKTVRLWNISNFKDTKMRRLVCTFTGHSKKVTDVHLSPEIVISSSPTIRIWNIQKKQITRVIHNKLHIQHMSVTEKLLVISDRSNSIIILDLASCLFPDLPSIISSNSSHMSRIAMRALHTYSSGAEILGLQAGITGIIFGANMHGRNTVEGRIVIQDFWQTCERDFFQELFKARLPENMKHTI